MKTVAEIITYLENEQAYCLEMHLNYRGKDAENALLYLIRSATIEGLLMEIKED